MNDCPNADIRDHLPDLVHDQLDAETRIVVVAHVAVCAECQAELALLRQVRMVLSSKRSVNVGEIVRALPSPKAASPFRVNSTAGGIRRVDWRIAAAVAFLTIGGASVVTYRSFGGPTSSVSSALPAAVPGHRSDSLAQVLETPAGSANSSGVTRGRAAAQSATSATSHPAELAMADGYVDMSTNELRALLGEIDQFEAVPPAEPDPVTVRTATGDPGSY